MKRVHNLEKISWSVKDKCGHRCVVCNSPYKNLSDLEFHVQQIHGVNTSATTADVSNVTDTSKSNCEQSSGVAALEQNEERGSESLVCNDSQTPPPQSCNSSPHSISSDQCQEHLTDSSDAVNGNCGVMILKNDQNSNIESMDFNINGDNNMAIDLEDVNKKVLGNDRKFQEPISLQ